MVGKQEELTVAALAKWCRMRVGAAYGAEEAADEEELADYMRLELRAVSEHFGLGADAGTLESVPDVNDEDEKALRVAGAAAARSPGCSGRQLLQWRAGALGREREAAGRGTNPPICGPAAGPVRRSTGHLS